MSKRAITIIFFFVIFSHSLLAQKKIIEKLQEIKGIAIIKEQSDNFKEYYEIMVDQPLDHFSTLNKNFKQRIFIGINNTSAPTVMETEGYAIGNVSKPEFINQCNLISVEHRYFGKSLPDSLNWNYLTIKQAAYDLHNIRELFGKLFEGKWISTGISKGGQTAIAYKMYFPNDVDATIAYVTPIKKNIDDKRIADYLKSISKTENGKKVFAFQKYAFRNKSLLLKEFDSFLESKGYSFGKMNNETVFDYILLEYPFAFYQNCFDSKLIPDTTASVATIIDEIVTVVSPRFYSDAFRSKLEPSFYMFYHELGYYEYDLASVKKWLANDNYPNNIFAPQNSNISFDSDYLTSINKFIGASSTEKLIFIYGERDPYTSIQAEIGNNKKVAKFIVKNGCHKSRIADLTKEQQQEIHELLSSWLK